MPSPMRCPSRLCSIMLALVACGDESTGAAQEPGCAPVGFAPMARFELPPGLGTIDDAYGGGSCEEDVVQWSVRDMTGDGLVDLVIRTGLNAVLGM